MTSSWSHKLFLRINAHVGKRPVLDGFMFFCAHWLIAIMAGALFAMSNVFDTNAIAVILFAVLGLFMLVAFGISWLSSFIWKHPRPIVEYPSITQILTPTQTIKSFPSDHALISWMIALFTISFPQLFYGTPYTQIAFILAAALVSVGRVYVGVHYPRDILGGLSLAIIMSLIIKYVVALII